MKLKEKLQMLMARHNLNGQKLARLSQVSDSEVSRILQGKSRPGLDNAFRLAKAVNVSLDYLADDSLDVDASQPADLLSSEERMLLALAHRIGCQKAFHILENVRFIGYDLAMSRMTGAPPLIEIDQESAEQRASASLPTATVVPTTQRATSVTG